MKSQLIISLSALFMVLATPVLGQTDVSAEPVDTELSPEEKKKIAEFQRQQAQAEKEASAEKNNTKRPKKVFKPTEEISEDSPVPFPVDI